MSITADTAPRAPLSVRPLTADDEAAWRHLWRGYLDFYETVLPETTYASSFAQLVDPGVWDYNGLLAERNGVPVGLAHFIFHRHGWIPAGTCYLQDLFVTADERGTGAGRALIEAVYSAADAAGRPDVYWLTQADNHQARALYDRIGRATPFIKYRR